MFGWLEKRRRRPQPEALWVVSVEPDHVQVIDDAGRTTRLAKSDMIGVAIETNDTGPWGADVWWLLFGSEGQLACAFPQGATGESGALDYLTQLPAFDYGQVAKAMGSTAKAVFPVWAKAR
ncbi:hypothetical protein [Sphingomonas aerophila]|uniref:Uncharacterized protein n=1 Tax=Sphingomonas aerophila TaxID=1344948 RepID=A0A7W9BBL8_9SPHN|nr:hypothetical protein [Sphingomonas aerophila]MBB5714197.1 hypothetical protein [Sphingomonas aerophila]